jgi:hypothetical protein
MNEKLIKALLKKAKGYETKEIIDEFTVDGDNAPVLNRRKITYKDVPPDIGAVKTIAEILNVNEYKDLSAEELQKEKRRLLEELQKDKRDGVSKRGKKK